MLSISNYFLDQICHIFVCVYVGVVDYSSFMQISTDVIANVNVFCSSFDDSLGDEGDRTLIVTVDWQR